jgi:hypothetical protein
MVGAGSGSAGGAANSAEAIVSTFRLGHVTMSPVLIISYEVLWGVGGDRNMEMIGTWGESRLGLVRGNRMRESEKTKRIRGDWI